MIYECKMKKPKVLEIGKMYKAPWKFYGHGGDPGSVSFYYDRIEIQDGSYVVLLEIQNQVDMWPITQQQHQTTYYWLKMLIGDGYPVWIQVSEAGIDYWKKVNTKKMV